MSAGFIPLPVQAPSRSSSRFGVGFGRRFFLLLAVGLVWLGPAFWMREFLYGMLLWDVFVVLLWVTDLVKLPAPDQIIVQRSWMSIPSLSNVSEIEITIENRALSSIYINLVEDVPTSFRDIPPTLEFNVPPSSVASARYEARPLQRGDFDIPKTYLRYRSPLNLAERWAIAELSQNIRVYPNMLETGKNSIYLLRSRQIERQMRRLRQRGLGRDFESLREYRQGDESRDICWPVSARRGKIVTKLYQAERSQAVWLIIDAGRLLRAKVDDLSKLDYAVSAAVNLAELAVHSGDRVGMIAYGRNIQKCIAAGAGISQVRSMLEQLATVQSEPSEADHLLASATLISMQKRRSLVVWITDFSETSMTPEVIEGARMLMPRHRVILAVVAQTDLAQMANRQPKTVAELYQYTAAQEMVQRRELLLARLRGHGALAVEVSPRGLSAALLERYLEVKERNQI